MVHSRYIININIKQLTKKAYYQYHVVVSPTKGDVFPSFPAVSATKEDMFTSFPAVSAMKGDVFTSFPADSATKGDVFVCDSVALPMKGDVLVCNCVALHMKGIWQVWKMLIVALLKPICCQFIQNLVVLPQLDTPLHLMWANLLLKYFS